MLPGSLISEEKMCESYCVSRTPVREALLRLEEEGYINIEPRKSTRVSKISFQEMNEIIEIRLLIEPYILRSLEEPLSDSYIEKFQDIRQRSTMISLNDATSLKYFLKLDFEFHTTLISLSNSKLLNSFCKDILHRSIRQWYLMYTSLEQRLSTAKDEHQAIIDLLIKGNFAHAAKELENHIRAFYDMMFFCG